MSKNNRELPIDQMLAREAKSFVALAFRNGPIEDVHAGKECPQCSGRTEYSHISQAEMKEIMKRAVDKVYALLWIRTHSPTVYEHVVEAGRQYTANWDLPEHSKKEIEGMTKLAEYLGTRKADAKPSR
jgi:hypothetical protein